MIGAMRISAIEESLRLRSLINIFPKDFVLFKLQSNEFKDYQYSF
jgi:hypothetical protein